MATLPLLLLPCGVAIGLLLGLTGAGGSVLGVPLLMFVGGLEPAAAGSLSLAAVSLAAMAGSVMRPVRGRSTRSVALLVLASAVPGAAAGVWFAHRTPSTILAPAFAVLMLAIAARVAWQARAEPVIVAGAIRAGDASADPAASARCPLGEDGNVLITSQCRRVLALSGAVAGATSGFFGVGGGFLVVPALTLVAGLPHAQAVTASLPVIAVASGTGFAVHALLGNAVPAGALVLALAGAVAGMLLARRLASHLPAVASQRLLAALIVVAALALLDSTFRST